MFKNFTSHYELEFTLMERRVGDRGKTSKVKEIRAELSLYFDEINK
jgi:hypothetical protein